MNMINGAFIDITADAFGRCMHCGDVVGSGGCDRCLSSRTFCGCGVLLRCGCGFVFAHQCSMVEVLGTVGPFMVLQPRPIATG